MKLKSLIVVLLCIVVCSSCEQPPIEAYAVLPQPQEINYVQGFVKLKDKPMVVYSNELSNEALLLASYLKNDFAVEVTLEEGKDKGDVILYWIRPFYLIKKVDMYWKLPEARLQLRLLLPKECLTVCRLCARLLKKEKDA